MADEARPEPDPERGEAGAPDEGYEHASTGLPPRVERWRQRSATGAILTGFAMGLREVFEPERKEPSITLETSGDPPRDLPVEADFDSFAARRSVVRIRPWLLERTGGSEDPEAPGAPPGDEEAGDGPGTTGEAR